MTNVLSRTLPILPTAAFSLGFVALAWREQGSVLAEDWLPYALAAGLLCATVLASGAALRPAPSILVGLSGLGALALWTAFSASWSPAPALARDEALLVLFYVLALAVPLMTLHAQADRVAALLVVSLASVTIVVATCVRLLAADAPGELFWATRLGSPMRYPGGTAALFLVSLWPTLALAAARSLHVALRSLALGGAVAILAGALMTQSRAAAVALAASAVVVFAVSSARMRLLIPAAVTLGLVAVSFDPLTEPFLKDEAALAEAARDAATTCVILAAVGIAIGLVYAVADRRLTIPPRLARAAAQVAAVMAIAGAVAGVAGFLVAVEQPADYLQNRWEQFKRQPEFESGSSHLETIGSNRYDFWRVALDEFREHPVRGAGGRAFGPAYLREGDTIETPLRSHSLVFDLLGETGIVGLGLLVAALAPIGWSAIRRARFDLPTAGVVGAAAYWLAHAAADWTWTFPAVGLPFFLLLAVGVVGGEEKLITPRVAIPAAATAIVVAVVAFAPPWLSARYTERALGQTRAEAVEELRWARRLDPLSVEPLVAEAELASTPEQAIGPLQEAVEREPEAVGPRYVLGLAYLDAGRTAEARRELREAMSLAPKSTRVRSALRRAMAARRAD